MKISSWLHILGSLMLVLCAMLTSGLKSVYIRPDAISWRRLFTPRQYHRSRTNHIAPKAPGYNRISSHNRYWPPDNQINKPCSTMSCFSNNECCRPMTCIQLGMTREKFCIRLSD